MPLLLDPRLMDERLLRLAGKLAAFKKAHAARPAPPPRRPSLDTLLACQPWDVRVQGVTIRVVYDEAKQAHEERHIMLEGSGA